MSLFFAKTVFLNQYSFGRGSKFGRSPRCSVPPGRAQREPQGYAGLTCRGDTCLTLLGLGPAAVKRQPSAAPATRSVAGGAAAWSQRETR